MIPAANPTTTDHGPTAVATNAAATNAAATNAAATDDAASFDHHLRWSSRQLHRLGALASHAWAGVVFFFIALGWIAYGAFAGFPSYWQATLESVTSIITVVMVSVIQHLQARDQMVTQRKLDEILRDLPETNHQLIALEGAPDDELEELTERNRQDHRA